MTEPIAATIYATQLTNQCEGYPLWDPDPQDEPAVEIADVGYIEKGAFIRLFNASRQPGDNHFNKLGVPERYHPLHIGEIQKRTCLPANVPIQSDSVMQLDMQVSMSAGAPIQSGGGLSFECSREQGAVLLLGDDADRRDALHKDAFLRYIRENYASWLVFANQAHERGISLNDLVLVTGCDKTSTWACAAFSGKSSQAGVSFNVGSTGIVQAGLSISWAWKNSSSVATRSGPRRSMSLATSSLEAPRSSRDRLLQPIDEDGNMAMTESRVGVAASWSPPARNQCVFLRGYRMCDRRTALARFLRRKKKAAYDGFHYVPPRKQDKEDPDAPGPSGRKGFLPNTSSTSGRSYLGGEPSWHSGPSGSASGLSETDNLDPGSFEDEIDELEEQDLYEQLNYEKEPTPLDLILEYILEKSGAALALVHDDDLIALLQNTGYVDDFETWIHELSPSIFIDDNQVGMLETSYLLSLPDTVDLSWAANLESKPLSAAYTHEEDTSVHHTGEIFSGQIRDTRHNSLNSVGAEHQNLPLYSTSTLSQQDYTGLSNEAIKVQRVIHRPASGFSDHDFSDNGEGSAHRDDTSQSHSSPHQSTSRSPETNKSPDIAKRRYRAMPAKTFACRGYGDCKMVFSRSEHLARHVRKHTGERPFACHCGKQFSRLDNLRQHAQTVHADKKDENERMMHRLTALHATMAAAVKGEARKKSTSRSENHPPSLSNLPSDMNSQLNNIMHSAYWSVPQSVPSAFPPSRPA